jgi:hypothetical protein
MNVKNTKPTGGIKERHVRMNIHEFGKENKETIV